TETKECRVAFPEENTPLGQNTRYRWRVDAVLEEGEDQVVIASEFSTLDRQIAGRLSKLRSMADSEDPGQVLLAALTYETYQVHDSVLPLYEKLAKAIPREPNFQERLARYY